MDQPHPEHERILDIIQVFYASSYMEEAIKIRRESFSDLAMFMQITTDELECILADHLQKTADELMNYYKDDPDHFIHKFSLEYFQYTTDFWSKIIIQELYLKTTTIDHFLKYYDGIWNFSNPYLEKLKFSLPFTLEKLDTKDDYYALLYQIPLFYSFELDFNSFISIKTKGEALPVIRFNYVLFSVLDSFIQNIGYVILKSDNQYKQSALREITEIVEISKSSEVVVAFYTNIKMLIGEATLTAKIKIAPEASYNLHFGLATIISPFLEYHEMAHLILGHLEKPYTKQLEYEADDFAFLYIKNLIKDHGEEVKFKTFLVISSFFLLLYCREQMLPLENHEFYPTATERLSNITKKFEIQDRKKFEKAWNNIVLCVDHTMKTHFNVEIPLAEASE